MAEGGSAEGIKRLEPDLDAAANPEQHKPLFLSELRSNSRTGDWKRQNRSVSCLAE
jgi:hypothetical protein